MYCQVNTTAVRMNLAQLHWSGSNSGSRYAKHLIDHIRFFFFLVVICLKIFNCQRISGNTQVTKLGGCFGLFGTVELRVAAIRLSFLIFVKLKSFSFANHLLCKSKKNNNLDLYVCLKSVQTLSEESLLVAFVFPPFSLYVHDVESPCCSQQHYRTQRHYERQIHTANHCFIQINQWEWR